MVKTYEPVRVPRIVAIQLTKGSIKEVLKFLDNNHMPFYPRMSMIEQPALISYHGYVCFYTYGTSSSRAYFGNYICKDLLNGFRVLSEEVFLAEYKQVTD